MPKEFAGQFNGGDDDDIVFKIKRIIEPHKKNNQPTNHSLDDPLEKISQKIDKITTGAEKYDTQTLNELHKLEQIIIRRKK